jgi:deoxyhypusine monooxygenase
VRETCDLAIARIEFVARNGDGHKSTKFLSVDPAPPQSDIVSVSVLKQQLLNTELTLFDRYRAMFALRDIGTEEAVLALADGLNVSCFSFVFWLFPLLCY